MPGYPLWPAILTDKDWQKKKGTLAKMLGESGVGSAMTAAENSFGTIDFTQMEITRVLAKDRHSTENIEKGRSEAGDYYTKQVEPTRKLIKTVEDTAKNAATKWKKNKLIPSSSSKHADAVAGAADMLWMMLKSNSSVMAQLNKTFDDTLDRNQRVRDQSISDLSKTIKLLEQSIEAYVKNISKAEWSNGNTSVHQRCRSMCNAIRNIHELSDAYWGTWQKFGDNYEKDAPEGGEEEKKAMTLKLKTLIAALKDFKATYTKHI